MKFVTVMTAGVNYKIFITITISITTFSIRFQLQLCL